MFGTTLAALMFPEAAALWLADRKRIVENSRKHYEDYIASLTEFFGGMRLHEIHIGHVSNYQRTRQEKIRTTKRHLAGKALAGGGVAEIKDCDGASRINHELSCLGQIMQKAGLWAEIKKFYEPLPLPKESPGMALTDEEKRWLLYVGLSRKRWHLAAYCSLLSRNTTAGPGEIRHLRLRDLYLDSPHGSFIQIEEGTKNEFRKRPMPLNADAEKAVRWLLERATEMGACLPDHYLLPHRAHKRGVPADPTRPMGSWKRAHREICKEVGKKFPRLLRKRMYDDRHTAATDLLEDPSVSFTTIEHMMGHRINSNTKRKYDHLRNSALRAAADALNRGHAGDGEIEPVPAKKPPEREVPPPAMARAATAG